MLPLGFQIPVVSLDIWVPTWCVGSLVLVWPLVKQMSLVKGIGWTKELRGGEGEVLGYWTSFKEFQHVVGGVLPERPNLGLTSSKAAGVVGLKMVPRGGNMFWYCLAGFKDCQLELSYLRSPSCLQFVVTDQFVFYLLYLPGLFLLPADEA